ncbi:DNRLRE domain-containing protein [Microtetraspora malaysiensis]|uniref:DNRLRE domain-containing protein n=1 Tax=Microtetraspora malaysiensis TaxID=161358 RepID=A0ABW6SRG2_9ACTN
MADPDPAAPKASASQLNDTRVVDHALEAAKMKAKETGKKVEVPSRFSETLKVWANPDGKTLHAELYSAPIQVASIEKDGMKRWDPIDTTIVRRSDGHIAARRTKAPLEFGDAGSQVLATSHVNDQKVGFRWGKKLPKPEISGNSITYRDAVTQGADLVVTALPEGFVQSVVLRTRPKGPLAVKLPMDLPKGTSYGKASDGTPQLMSPQGKPEAAPIAVQALDAIESENPESGKVGKVSTNVTTDASGASTLVLEPDAAFLSDASVSYPVTISVSSSWVGAGLAEDTFVNNADYPYGSSNASLDRILVGKSNSGTVTWRGYLRFLVQDTDLDYATIADADLRLWNYLSGGQDATTGLNCGKSVGSGIVARRITSNWSQSSLTWSNQPSYTTSGQVGNKAAYSSDCSWGEGELYYSIQNMVQDWADHKVPDYGILLQSTSESDSQNWRRYRSSEYAGTSGRGPVLFIDYTPVERHLVVSNYNGDAWSAGPSYDTAVSLQVPTTSGAPDLEGITQDQAMEIKLDRANPRVEIGRDKLQPFDGEDWSNNPWEPPDEVEPTPQPDTTAPTEPFPVIVDHAG